MKGYCIPLVLLFFCPILQAQTSETDSLRQALKNETSDTGRIVTMYKLSLAYQDSKPDSALLLAEESYFLSKKIKFTKGESWSLNEMAFALNSLGNFPKALQYYLQQLQIEETRGYPDNIALVYLNIALLYESAKDMIKPWSMQKEAILLLMHIIIKYILYTACLT